MDSSQRRFDLSEGLLDRPCNERAFGPPQVGRYPGLFALLRRVLSLDFDLPRFELGVSPMMQPILERHTPTIANPTPSRAVPTGVVRRNARWPTDKQPAVGDASQQSSIESLAGQYAWQEQVEGARLPEQLARGEPEHRAAEELADPARRTAAQRECQSGRR